MDNTPPLSTQTSPQAPPVTGTPPRLGTPVPGTTGGLPALGGLSVLQNPMAKQLQSMGRGEDSVLVHMTPGEVGGLQQLAMASGGSLTVNPHTGLPEAGWLSKLLPTIAGVALGFTPLAPFAPLIVGGGTAALTGDLKKGLTAGLQAWGGGSLGAAAKGAMTAGSLGAAGVGAAGKAAADFAATEAGGIGAAANPGVMSRFATAAKASVPQAVQNAGKLGAMATKYAPYAAASGLMSGISGATQPNIPTYKPQESKSTYGGPYVPADRQLRMPTRQDDEAIGTGEFNYFSPNVLSARPVSSLSEEERRKYGFAEGGSTSDTTTTSAPDYAAYVNAYPNDLLPYFNAHPTDYGDYNNDGVVDINDFGLGHWNTYGQREGRSLTGPTAPAPATTPTNTASNTGVYVDPSLTNTSLTQIAPTSSTLPQQQVFGGQSPFTGDFGRLVDYFASTSPPAPTPSPVSLWNVPTSAEKGYFGRVPSGTSGTGGTGTNTTGTNTTNKTTFAPISDAERAKWAAYVNAYPDLAAAFAKENNAYGDYNHDGKIDIADFGLGHYTTYGQKEQRSLTGPAPTGSTTTTTTQTAPRASDAFTLDQLKQMFPGSAYFDPTSPVYDPTGNALRGMIDGVLTDRTNGMDPGSGTYQQISSALENAGYTTGVNINAYDNYLDANPDVAKAAQESLSWVGDVNKDGVVSPEDYAQWHYATFGQNEGRDITLYARGGLMGLKAGGVHMGDGSFVLDARTVSEIGNGSSNAGKEVLARMGGRPLDGPGDGVSDSIPANIGGHQKARVARDEVIMPPHVVNRLGNGNASKGAQKLYSLMDRAHKARKQAKRGQDTGLRRGLA